MPRHLHQPSQLTAITGVPPLYIAIISWPSLASVPLPISQAEKKHSHLHASTCTAPSAAFMTNRVGFLLGVFGGGAAFLAAVEKIFKIFQHSEKMCWTSRTLERCVCMCAGEGVMIKIPSTSTRSSTTATTIDIKCPH